MSVQPVGEREAPDDGLHVWQTYAVTPCRLLGAFGVLGHDELGIAVWNVWQLTI